jgi:hypothetical protein
LGICVSYRPAWFVAPFEFGASKLFGCFEVTDG